MASPWRCGHYPALRLARAPVVEQFPPQEHQNDPRKFQSLRPDFNRVNLVREWLRLDMPAVTYLKAAVYLPISSIAEQQGLAYKWPYHLSSPGTGCRFRPSACMRSSSKPEP